MNRTEISTCADDANTWVTLGLGFSRTVARTSALGPRRKVMMWCNDDAAAPSAIPVFDPAGEILPGRSYRSGRVGDDPPGLLETELVETRRTELADPEWRRFENGDAGASISPLTVTAVGGSAAAMRETSPAPAKDGSVPPIRIAAIGSDADLIDSWADPCIVVSPPPTLFSAQEMAALNPIDGVAPTDTSVIDDSVFAARCHMVTTCSTILAVDHRTSATPTANPTAEAGSSATHTPRDPLVSTNTCGPLKITEITRHAAMAAVAAAVNPARSWLVTVL
ncbi:hypothetical protein BC828DRAFT_386450 [Blastocladiella britannica]|nr:hypothetical protein BC828DRAFT_386450 [Blastocladiella britannica]